ncbi:hypothetical protein AVEN_135038-1 [Araneus ventricosus]|uniref:Uncharacterized protein n=1 Tax=Araneus ventricosus TaxID=182803 RepID=A0A4Y2CY43_ARAVE|nr:hypothetical protein AVEN_135038-1 [Araneus ventricosus]
MAFLFQKQTKMPRSKLGSGDSSTKFLTSISTHRWKPYSSCGNPGEHVIMQHKPRVQVPTSQHRYRPSVCLSEGMLRIKITHFWNIPLRCIKVGCGFVQVMIRTEAILSICLPCLLSDLSRS